MQRRDAEVEEFKVSVRRCRCETAGSAAEPRERRGHGTGGQAFLHVRSEAA